MERKLLFYISRASASVMLCSKQPRKSQLLTVAIIHFVVVDLCVSWGLVDIGWARVVLSLLVGFGLLHILHPGTPDSIGPGRGLVFCHSERSQATGKDQRQ